MVTPPEPEDSFFDAKSHMPPRLAPGSQFQPFIR
jgi:hypothetical protein